MPNTNVHSAIVDADGNVFNLIGIVSRDLKKAGFHDEAKEFREKAFASDSYDAVLRLISEYVEVE